MTHFLSRQISLGWYSICGHSAITRNTELWSGDVVLLNVRTTGN